MRALVSEEADKVDALLMANLTSEIQLINQLGAYIIQGGGKRIRPLIALLSAKSLGYSGQQHIDIAAILELVHTATLLHDDVVDSSKLRRGRQTANDLWGTEASVLVGDFLYSRAFQMMVTLNNNKILGVLADATNVIAEGEVMQLVNCHDPDITELRYLDTIRNKTAKLFEAASGLGAILSGGSDKTTTAMNAYGMHLGTAFQLADDALDYSSSPEKLGKNIGDDLSEGKPTLPLLYAMWHGTAGQADTIREAIKTGGLDQLSVITTAIESTSAISYTKNLAEEEAKSALASIKDVPPSPYKEALEDLAQFSFTRDF
ncbi:MAG: octaprenyl diphosphate synthase [Proteobacteria bacterium]|jgi:octaprenyl-diphosphate synthase|nr:octaprenyl diphosphate synthase [Pseudomonadota bacterium]MBT5064826.1 octaprenyl diphosphate synthase [Pseudomonadota bacterium]MBT6193658.1 octaprenyl diphosphate synthase [Pseudomonadota bacterium]MBT6464389.1 octaprenyl diphosphate synthase [Pseudomonadota bacterium]MBT6674434.1 octaprenyl diphosphate synthase [Pseudomonadota bacterium]